MQDSTDDKFHFMDWLKRVWGFMLTILFLGVFAFLGWCTDLPHKPPANPGQPAPTQPKAP